MNSSRKISPSSPVTLVIALATGMIVVFGLVYLFFTNQPAPQNQTVAAVQEATPTWDFPMATLFPDAPPFPEPSGGTAFFPPTPDPSDFPPFPAFDSTDEPPDKEEEDPPGSTEVPTFPPVVPYNPLAPSAEVATYTDRLSGLTFEYPANWFLTGTSKQAVGGVITIINSEPNSESGGSDVAPTAAFAINISVPPDSMNGFDSLASYVDSQTQEVDISSKQHLDAIQGNEVIAVIYPSPLGGKDFEDIYLAKGDTIYHISVPTPYSEYHDVIFQILNSFVFP